ncbi:MAG TPA: DMT family transporter [Methanomassiliicoccales archaeon]|nr:DMT family transporter [Methanomassiliicoccales archaeon]
MVTDISPKTGAVLSTLLSSLMMGSSYVAVKMQVGSTNPFLLGAATMAVGSLALILYMFWRRIFTKAMLGRWEFWAASLANTCVVAPTYVGLTMTTASAGALIIGTNVIFVAFFSRLAFRESLSLHRTAGLVLAMMGLITLTTRWDPSTLEGTQMLGNLLMLTAAAGIGVVVIMSRVALRTLRPEQWTLGLHMFLPATLLALSFLIPLEGSLNLSALPVVMFVGLLCTTLPAVLWIGALKHLSVVSSATILLCESAFAVFLSWLVLGESIDAFVAIGAVMIFSAILIMARTD